MVRVRLTKPRVRLVRVAAPELLVIDGLDLLTALSTLPYLHSTTRFVNAVSLRSPARFLPGLVPDAAGGVFPCRHAFNHPGAKDCGSEFREEKTMTTQPRGSESTLGDRR